MRFSKLCLFTSAAIFGLSVVAGPFPADAQSDVNIP